jgi:hypothetical protein
VVEEEEEEGGDVVSPDSVSAENGGSVGGVAEERDEFEERDGMASSGNMRRRGSSVVAWQTAKVERTGGSFHDDVVELLLICRSLQVVRKRHPAFVGL